MRSVVSSCLLGLRFPGGLPDAGCMRELVSVANILQELVQQWPCNKLETLVHVLAWVKALHVQTTPWLYVISNSQGKKRNTGLQQHLSMLLV